MQRAYPLAQLSEMVATARAQQRPARLVLRNTERFGLIHLYFAHGRLIRVEGHRETPLRSLEDLAAWRVGVVRRDDVEELPGALAADPALEAALDYSLRVLESHGISRAIRSVTPPTPQQGPQAQRAAPLTRGTAGPSMVFDLDAATPSAPPPTVTMEGLPSLSGVGPQGESIAATTDRLTDPQWQLIAIAVRQVVEQAAQAIGLTMAEGLMRRALARVATVKPPLRGMELDASGWLRLTPGVSLAGHSRYEFVEAIAALLGNFELRCASLVGPERAKQIITAATLPLSSSLAQVGLTISG
jgi:hypothetical protein